jgi:hypothetical protein
MYCEEIGVSYLISRGAVCSNNGMVDNRIWDIVSDEDHKGGKQRVANLGA